MQENNIKKYDFQTISNDVDFSAEDGLLFEFASVKSIDEIANPMNEKSDEIIIETLFQYR